MSKVTQELSITVNPAAPPPPPPLQIVTTSLPAATVGQVYQAQIMVAGGTPPDTVALESGQLPDGLTLNSDGSITGTPSDAAVSETFVVSVTDSGTSTQSPQVAKATVNLRIPVAPSRK